MFWLESDKAQVVLPAASSLVLVGRPPTLGLFTALSVVVEGEGAGRDSRSLMLLFNISSCLRLALSPELIFRKGFSIFFSSFFFPTECYFPAETARAEGNGPEQGSRACVSVSSPRGARATRSPCHVPAAVVGGPCAQITTSSLRVRPPPGRRPPHSGAG